MRMNAKGQKMGKVLAVVAPAVASLAWASSAGAQELVFRDGASNAVVTNYDGTSDNLLYYVPTTANSEHTNWGAWNQIYGSDATAVTRRSILAFDLSALQGQGLAVQSATLRLTQTFGNNTVATANSDFSLYEVLPANAGWAQGDNSATAADAGESTWNNKAHPDTAWAGSPGMSTPDVDYASTPVYFGDDVYNFAQSSIGTVFEITLPADMVQAWIDNPASNAGLLLRGDPANGNYRYPTGFASSEFTTLGTGGVGNETWRPTLTVVVPEPAGVGLLGAAGLFLAGRRRRHAND